MCHRSTGAEPGSEAAAERGVVWKAEVERWVEWEAEAEGLVEWEAEAEGWVGEAEAVAPLECG